MTAVVDGFSGQVIFEPEEDVQKETEKRMQEEAEKQKLLEELKGKENITPDGRDRKSTRLNSSHRLESRMPSSA